MRNGNWRPLSKYLVKYFPKHRPYTKLEAAFCLQCDYDDHSEVTISGYSALWQWSRKKVNLFLEQMNIEIIYPENTQKKQNQKGQIRIQIRDRKEADKGQIRLIDFSELQAEKNRQGTDKGQIRDRYGSTTIDTKILDPETNTKNTISSELKNSSKPIISIPLVDRTEYPIYQANISEWQESYPVVDILQALRSLKQWNISNPKKQKTPKGIRRHITTWLEKEQNKGGQYGFQRNNGKTATRAGNDGEEPDKYSGIGRTMLTE